MRLQVPRRRRATALVATSVLGAALLSVGCAPKMERLLTCEQYYQRGLQALQHKKWLKAQAAFEKITLNYPGCDLVDDAQYMLGETDYRQQKYIEAQFEYRRVVEDFRTSDRMEDAQFMMAMCADKEALPASLDQTSTNEAIFRFQQYLEDYPNGKWAKEARQRILDDRKKLAKKDYDIARFYFRQRYYDASTIYLDHIINNYSDTGEWLERARFLKAVILSRKGNDGEALNLLRSIDMSILNPGLRAEVRRTIAKLSAGG